MLRYRILAWIMCLIAVVIVCRAGYIMTAKRDYWIQVSDRLKADSVPVKPTRGNILSTDRQLLASSLPEYMLFVDFKTMRETQTDTLWEEKECYGEGVPMKSSSAGVYGREKSWWNRRHDNLQNNLDAGRRESLARRLERNRADRLQERASGRHIDQCL